jgi:hypothetical protein
LVSVGAGLAEVGVGHNQIINKILAMLNHARAASD